MEHAPSSSISLPSNALHYALLCIELTEDKQKRHSWDHKLARMCKILKDMFMYAFLDDELPQLEPGDIL